MTEFTLTPHSRLLCNPDVILRENEPGGPMLFNPDNSEMLILNETGLWIWQHCTQENSLEILTKEMLELYANENTDQIAKDLSLFVQNMADQGFIGILC